MNDIEALTHAVWRCAPDGLKSWFTSETCRKFAHALYARGFRFGAVEGGNAGQMWEISDVVRCKAFELFGCTVLNADEMAYRLFDIGVRLATSEKRILK